MSKGYWICFYRSVFDEAALARYAALAGPLIESQGGRILTRAVADFAYEAGLKQRTVLVEFASVERAREVYESPAYQEVLVHLKGAVERDLRLIQGI